MPDNLSDAIKKIFSDSVRYDELSIPGDEKIKFGTIEQMETSKREEFLMDLAANVKLLNLKWIELMAKTQSQLREKMSLFWHNHLALRGRGVKQVENYSDTKLSTEKLLNDDVDYHTENGLNKLSLAFTQSLSYQLM